MVVPVMGLSLGLLSEALGAVLAMHSDLEVSGQDMFPNVSSVPPISTNCAGPPNVWNELESCLNFVL